MNAAPSYVGAVERVPATLDTVVRAFIAGTDGFKFDDGRRLTVSDDVVVEGAESDARLPFLSIVSVAANSANYSPDKDVVDLTLNCTFRTRAHAGMTPARSFRVALLELDRACDRIRGLPIDETGKVVPRDEESAWRAARGEVADLVDYYGPKIGQVRGGVVPGGPYARADLQVTFRYYQDREALRSWRARAVVVGLRLGDAMDASREPDEWPAVETATADVKAAGLEDTEAPDVSPGVRGFPPFPAGDSGAPPILGADPDDLLDSVNVTPYAVSVAAGGGTSQLRAIGTYRSGVVRDMTGFASWATSAPLVASVSAGLVTGAGAGSASVTASFLGRTSNACVVTVA